ncbi:Neuropeptide Y receptor, partial [Orchesella cincta]
MDTPATSSSDCDHGKEPEDQLIVDQAHSFNPVSTEHVTEELPLRLPTWGIVILVIGYALVFIFGVIGNCSVLVVVKRLRRMKTVTNYFIFNLAVADLLVLLFCLLPNLVSNIFIPWVLGSALCKIVPYIQGVSVCASIYFLVAISVERCISIQWPLKYQITKEKAKFVILAIWLWSCIVALPWSIFFQSGPFDPDNPSLEFCIEIWPDSYQNWSTYYFLIGNLFLCYVFPLTVILLCYLTIWFRVYRRPVPSDSYHKAMELIHQRSKTA